MNELEIWRTVTLGIFKNADEYRTALTKVKMHISKRADDMLSTSAFICAHTQTEVDLVIRSVRQLGFLCRARYCDICLYGLGINLNLCPNEIGPASRFICADTSERNWHYIATQEVITDSRGDIRTFKIGYGDNKFLLCSHYAHPGHLYNLDDRFLFVRPREEIMA